MKGETYLEPFVLQNLLDRNVTVWWHGIVQELCLEDDSEGTISDDFAVGILEVPGVSRLAVRCDYFDHFARIVDGWLGEKAFESRRGHMFIDGGCGGRARANGKGRCRLR